MKRLTSSRARELIKREVGLSATSLTAPPEMNGNRDYSWYEMISGNMKVVLSTTGTDHFTRCDMIALSVTHENSLFGVTEYFYADTMEYAPEYTEMKRREDICEIMCEEDDPTLKRLSQEASDALWHHYLDSKKVEHATSPVEDMKSKQEMLNSPETTEKQRSHPEAIGLSESDLMVEKAAWDNFQGKLLKGHDLFMIRVFNLKEEYYSDAGPFDETQLNWWVNNVTRCVDNNPQEAAGFTIFTWDRSSKDWVKYSPDGFTTLTYDTGRRPDGVWENYKQQLPPLLEKNSLQYLLSRAQQSISNETRKPSVKSKDQCIE